MNLSPPPARPAPKAAARPKEQKTSIAYRAVALALAAISIATIAALLWTGWAYYRLPLAQRVRSPLHDSLKPGGTLGRKLGIAGSALMLANLAYMLRRRVKVLQRVGTQRLWLEAHIFCGLTGPAILVFHSAFLTNNLIAQITAWSTGVVVAAGVVGRYIYAQLPRNIYGKELTLAEVRTEEQALLDELTALLPPDEAAAAGLAAFAVPQPAGKKGAPQLLLRSLLADCRRIAGSFALARRLRRAGLDRAQARAAARATRRAARLGIKIIHLKAFQRLLARWRGIHLKLAFVMVVCMVIHVAVVTLLGYGLV